MQQPLVLIVAGAVVVLVLFGVLQQTGKKWALIAMVAAALATVGLVVVERMVITPEEAVRATLYAIAKDVERGDIEAVVAHLSSRSPELHDQVRAVMKPYRAEEVRVTQIRDLVVQPDGGHASVHVHVRAVGGDRGGMFEHQPYFPQFNVTFVLEEDQWRVQDYEPTDANPLR
jgi:hypothetical protein